MEYVIGLDVGTDSIRGALVDKTGKIWKVKIEEITTWNPKPDFYQQSSTEIWFTCCKVIKKLTENITPESVTGLGFDATCSLAVCDADGNPTSVDLNGRFRNNFIYILSLIHRAKYKVVERMLRVNLNGFLEYRSWTKYEDVKSSNTHCNVVIWGNRKGDDNQNIILWMDHRAKTETNIINEIQCSILGYQDKNISIEKSIPKMLWLKRNLPLCWQRAAHYYLLPDFLTWRATGRNSRSLCSVVCGFNYESSPDDDGGGWMKSYFDVIGLHELAENNWEKIALGSGSKVISPGEFCGTLNEKTARETGLPVGTPVAAALIDAHSGTLGLIGCHSESIPMNLTSRLALVCGTSTCHMYHTEERISVPGVWGPYFNVLIPDLWLLYGGQSVSGKLIDHVINTHPAARSIRENNPHTRIVEYLNNVLYKMCTNKGLRSFDELTEDMHVYPDFHGNRSPIADENLRGMVLGLTLESDENNLALLYLATIQALVSPLLICGGLSKNTIFVESHANALGLKVLLPEETESVLLGSAMLAASASHFYPDLKAAAMNMAGQAKLIDAQHGVKKFHDKKYKVYLEMLECQMKSQKWMKSP